MGSDTFADPAGRRLTLALALARGGGRRGDVVHRQKSIGTNGTLIVSIAMLSDTPTIAESGDVWGGELRPPRPQIAGASNSITNVHRGEGGSRLIKIDVHNHVMPERSLGLLQENPVYGVKLRGRSWSGGLHPDFEIQPSFVEPDAKLKELESKGLDAAVVSVAPPLLYYHLEAGEAGDSMARVTNQGLAEFCEAEPGRLRWLATLPMQLPERAAATLEEAVMAGAVGAEIGTAVGERRLDMPEFDPVWSTAERLGVPITLHPAYGAHNIALDDYYLQNVLGFLFETTIAIERLIVAGVLDRYPSLRLVLLHGGGYFPYQVGRLRHAHTVRPELATAPSDPWAYRERVFFDTITHDPAALAFLIDRAGADRVVMGTDLPFDMATPDPLGLLASATTQENAIAIAERNPAALYGFPAPS